MDVAFLSDTGIAVVAVLVVVIFGGSQLPKLARNLGLAGKEFRRAHDAAEAEAAGKPPAAATPAAVTAAPAVPPAVGPAPAAGATPAAAPVATPAGVPGATPAAQASPPDDRVTISKAELAAFIEEREAQARRQANS